LRPQQIHNPKLSAKSEEIPFKMIQGGAYVDFEYADAPSKEVIRLLIDTGAAQTVVRSNDGYRGSTSVKIRSLSNPSVIAHAQVAGGAAQFPKGVDGVLGLDYMRAFSSVELDYRACQFRFRGGGVGTDFTGAGLPFFTRQVGSGSLLFINMNFGDCATLSLIDTGSPVTIVTPEASVAAEMTRIGEGNDDIISTGIEGTRTTLKAMRCGKLQSGSLKVYGATLYSGTVPLAAAAGLTGRPFALLGLDVLAGDPSQAFTIDFVNQRLFIGAGKKNSSASVSSLSLGELIYEIESLLKITCGPTTDETTGLVCFPSRQDLEGRLLQARSQPKADKTTPVPASKRAQNSMSVTDLKKELASLGISTTSFVEKRGLVDALEAAIAAKTHAASNSAETSDTLVIPFVILGHDGAEIVTTKSNAVIQPSSLGRFVACRIRAPGGHKLLMLLDTACSGVVLRPQVADRIGLSVVATPSSIMSGAGGNTICGARACSLCS
jgi:predicted aspartyl protease